jgi:glutamine---fructose-6-phosphate transaminase (isomerizing)
MCGIFGYVGHKNAVKTVLEGLKKLEYRGYDSAGIAGIHEGEIAYCKEVGKIDALEKEVDRVHLTLDMAIAQTRWATHGKPSQINAHPHFDQQHTIALVHNGIIENYDAIKKMLIEKGVQFVSETDTEVVAHLIAHFYTGNILHAVQKAVPLLQGSYAIALIHRDHPGQIIAIAHESPLVVGIGQKEAFISSDSIAFAAHTREVIFLSNSEIAIVKPNKIEVFDASQERIDKKTQVLTETVHEISKGSFDHFTLKEIYEQPQVIRNALLSRFLEEYGTAIFEEHRSNFNELMSVQRIVIVACGTSWHAANVGAYLLEDKARIPVQVEISSEFRYKNPIILPGTFAIAISQSGETADTLAAMRELKAKGAKVLAICNVQGSTIAREADECIFLRAGPEIGVCSTKAFTSQLVILSLLTLLLSRMRHMSKQEGQEFISALKQLPNQVQSVLDNSSAIERIAKKYANYDNFFFVGRRYMYPTSLEGALKLKEISYINANGYPAGEMKHGPIALINEDCPSVVLCTNKMTFDKLLSNIMEIKARHGKVIAIVEESENRVDEIADDIIRIPDVSDELASIPVTVVMQLLAYYIAKERGANIDQPRNLAKSVTVE